MEENMAILANLPTSIRGFVYMDENGEPIIVVNSRLTREANRKTFRHEKKHIRRGELTDPDYKEYD